MKKNKLLLHCVLVFSFFLIFPKNSFAFSLEKARSLEVQYDVLKEKVHEDVKITYKLKLDESFKEVDIVDLGLLAKEDSSLFQILDVSNHLCKNYGCFGKPFIYLHKKNEESYILAKQYDGKNVLIKLERDEEGIWKITNTQKK
ncbi:hypothetical protein ABN702_05810 [Bacillus haimaensis]|uniref:hypothetical protein n=1 Tax=Bacillus haimaensis TaxID=3160967 RepID=UPI003AA832CF